MTDKDKLCLVFSSFDLDTRFVFGVGENESVIRIVGHDAVVTNLDLSLEDCEGERKVGTHKKEQKAYHTQIRSIQPLFW